MTLEEDPDYFFTLNGYFFVVGYSTGASFEGRLVYKSSNTTLLKDVSVNIDASFKKGPFSVSGGHAYRDIKDTKDGSVDFESSVNATGSSNLVWNGNDIAASHNKF
jgi:hypothetical protein